MDRRLFLTICGAMVAVAGASRDALAQQKKSVYKPAPVADSSSSAEAVLAQASEAGKFTFLVFHKDESSVTRRMQQVVEDGVAARQDLALFALAHASDRANAALVEKFALSRSPMPVTVVVAPNGAITGIFAKQVQDEHLESAIVTPTMMKCMKSLQEDKLVFVCVRSTPKAAAPACIKQMQADPEFKDRISLVSMQLDDPNEGRFFEQMKLDPASVDGAIAVLLAPPGVLIGKYGAAATGDDVATALHQAGKCCDDPNCKHNKGATQPQAKKPVPTKRGAR